MFIVLQVILDVLLLYCLEEVRQWRARYLNLLVLSVQAGDEPFRELSNHVEGEERNNCDSEGLLGGGEGLPVYVLQFVVRESDLVFEINWGDHVVEHLVVGVAPE